MASIFRRHAPFSQALTAPRPAGWETHLDRFGVWVAVAILLILLAYGPFLLGYRLNMVSPGYRLF